MITVEITEARSVDYLRENFLAPDNTYDGPVCASCSRFERQITSDPKAQVRHATVAHVRWCAVYVGELEAEAAAERDAETRNERYFEERGASDYDPRDLYDAAW